MKIKKILNTFTSFLLISAFLIFIGLGTFFINAISSINTKDITPITSPKYSIILDDKNRIVEDFRQNSMTKIEYEDIPQLLIDALISIEDREFFIHSGINEKRIFSSLISNINSSNNTQGASTLAQQLVKNLLLSNEKTYKRKVQEAYLALQLEQALTKEEILELYFNRIYFEQSIPGIQYACYKFFSKDVSNITLPEAALLVGLVKSPSYYYPLNFPERANNRKNEVLKAMLNNGKIDSKQYNLACNFNISDLIKQESNSNQAFQYQAYLDVVYKEVKEITGYDIYSFPLKVETYIDCYLQDFIDKVQEGTVISFSNPHQQIGGAILNKNSKIIGVIGGRNYKGKKLFNHAYDLRTSPASTMKPIFSYALAVEHLHFNTLTTLEDSEYYYPGTSIKVNNADKSYLGKIPLIDALGYSRNTCAVSTLEKVANKIGIEKVKTHLNNLNLMDQGPFTYSYAIGGMASGVSPINIAGAYSMLLNDGKYTKPTTIKKITSLESGEILYEDNLKNTQIISEESADIITNTLERIVNDNYLSMKEAKPNNIKIAGKTGTGAYSKQIINKYNFPSNADKDIWFSGYSPNYTCSIWSGFDEPLLNEKTYFSGKENGKKIPKLLFKKIMEQISNKNTSFEISNNLVKAYVVKGLSKSYIPNELTPSKYISFAYYKKEDLPSETLPYPILNKINMINGVLYENILCFSILDKMEKDNIYSTFFGEKGYQIDVYLNSISIDHFFITSSEFEVAILEKGTYEIYVSESFKNNTKLKGDSYKITFTY